MANKIWVTGARVATALAFSSLGAVGCEAISGVNDLEVVATGGSGDGSVGQGGTGTGGALGSSGASSGGAGGAGTGGAGTGGSAGASSCTDASQCSGQDTECSKRSCASGKCGFEHTASGTPGLAQTAGDCKKNECNGGGNLVAVDDPTDPKDDGNACTKNVCTSGEPQHPPEPLDTECGTTTTCDGAGNCVGCTASAQCPADTECSDWSCETATGKCVSAPRSTTTTCGSGPSCLQGIESLQDLCDGAGACVDSGTKPCSPLTCGTDACRTTCTSDSHCVAAHYCAGSGVNSCLPKKGQGASCNGVNECASGFCVDGVCCETACSGLCNTCNGVDAGGLTPGFCFPIRSGSDPNNECAAGRACNGSNACTGVIQCDCSTPTYSDNENCCASCGAAECPTQTTECNAQDDTPCSMTGNVVTYRTGDGIADQSGNCPTAPGRRCAVGTCTCRP